MPIYQLDHWLPIRPHSAKPGFQEIFFNLVSKFGAKRAVKDLYGVNK